MAIPILNKNIQREVADKAKNSFNLKKKSQKILRQAKVLVETAIEQGEEMVLNNMNWEEICYEK